MNREGAKRERVVPMDPAIKKVAIVIALALLVVIGLICVIHGESGKEAAVATMETNQTESSQIASENTQPLETKEADAQQMPADEAMAGEVSKTNEALIDEDAQEIEMYEGALAGLSEEEIAKMALAEEQGKARTETTGIENAID